MNKIKKINNKDYTLSQKPCPFSLSLYSSAFALRKSLRDSSGGGCAVK